MHCLSTKFGFDSSSRHRKSRIPLITLPEGVDDIFVGTVGDGMGDGRGWNRNPAGMGGDGSESG